MDDIKIFLDDYSNSFSKLNSVKQKAINSVGLENINDFYADLSSKINTTAGKIDLEIIKKVGANEIISAINMSPENIKILANKIYLIGYVTVGDLESTDVTTINNARITSGIIEGKTMIALNGQGRDDNVLTINNADSYFEYIRCTEAWKMSEDFEGYRVPLIHCKYGTKGNIISNEMLNRISFYTGTDGAGWLMIENTLNSRIEFILLDQSYYSNFNNLSKKDIKTVFDKFEQVEFLNDNISKFDLNSKNILNLDTVDESWLKEIGNTGTYNLNKDVVISDLVKLNKEQQVKIENLENRLEKLEQLLGGV